MDSNLTETECSIIHSNGLSNGCNKTQIAPSRNLSKDSTFTLNVLSQSLEQTLETQPSSTTQGVEDVVCVSYESELQMPDIMRLIQKDLSEPYSIYTYRYFIHNWPKLCFLVSVLWSLPFKFFGNNFFTFYNNSFNRRLMQGNVLEPLSVS